MTQPEDNFIGRWSRRKREQGKELEKEAGTPQPEAVGDNVVDEPKIAKATESASVADQEVSTIDAVVTESGNEHAPVPAPPTDADMVALDTLDADSDYAPFMSEGVSSELRKAALKKLFFSGKFAARDGLDDYDDDFTNFEPLGDTVTSDMKFHARRKEKDRLAKLEEERLALEARAESASDSETTDTVETESADSDTAGEPEQVEQNTNDSEAPADAPEAPEIQHASIQDNQQESQTDSDIGKTA